MAWEIWDPFEDMRKIQKEMERTFRDFYRLPEKSDKKELIREPLADIIERRNDVLAKIELPGVEKKDIELNVTDNMLSVKAEKKHEIKQEKDNFYRHERSYQSFQRAFTLPCKVLPDKAEAKFQDGVLEVVIPKETPKIEEKNKVKKIAIK